MKRVLIILCLFVTACASSGRIKNNREINKVYFIPYYIHIVSDCSMYEWEEARKECYPGYAFGNEVWVIGEWVNDKIQVDWDVLGHEVLHPLAWFNKEIEDPDKYYYRPLYRDRK